MQQNTVKARITKNSETYAPKSFIKSYDAKSFKKSSHGKTLTRLIFFHQ